MLEGKFFYVVPERGSVCGVGVAWPMLGNRVRGQGGDDGS